MDINDDKIIILIHLSFLIKLLNPNKAYIDYLSSILHSYLDIYPYHLPISDYLNASYTEDKLRIHEIK